MIAYKVFRVEQASAEPSKYTCGYKSCPHPDHAVVPKPGKRILLAEYKNDDKTLQKVGDKASARLPLIICQNGWHGFTPAQSSRWVNNFRWQSGRQSLWRVSLTGEIKRASDKVVGQHIEMIEELTWNSVAGRKFREARNVQQQRQRERQHEAQKRRDARFRLKVAAQREREKLKKEARRKREILEVARQIKSLQSKQKRLSRSR